MKARKVEVAESPDREAWTQHGRYADAVEKDLGTSVLPWEEHPRSLRDGAHALRDPCGH